MIEMATNPYLNRFGNEDELTLQESLLIELIQAKGTDVVYLPRVLLTKDDILNEVVNSYYARGIVIEMFLESYEDWENNAMEFSTFGMMQMPNVSTWIVSKKRFEEEVDQSRLGFAKRPNEGDIIYSPQMKEFFVIQKVNKDDPTKARDRWVIRCEKYDDANNINIDVSDYVDETDGIVDKRLEDGFGDQIAASDIAQDFLEELNDENLVVEFDPSMSAEELCKKQKEAEEKYEREQNLKRAKKKHKNVFDNSTFSDWSENDLYVDAPDDEHK